MQMLDESNEIAPGEKITSLVVIGLLVPVWCLYLKLLPISLQYSQFCTLLTDVLADGINHLCLSPWGQSVQVCFLQPLPEKRVNWVSVRSSWLGGEIEKAQRINTGWCDWAQNGQKMFLKEEMLLRTPPWGCDSLPRQSQTLLQPKIVFVFESLSSSPMPFLCFCTCIWAGFAGTQYSPSGIKTCSVSRNEQLVFHKEGLPANKRIFQYVPLKWLLAGKWASFTMEPFIKDACTNFNRNKTFD